MLKLEAAALQAVSLFTKLTISIPGRVALRLRTRARRGVSLPKRARGAQETPPDDRRIEIDDPRARALACRLGRSGRPRLDVDERGLRR